jgi:threonylcarbamoyladenosine tRNA methylthiotransferase MtaB
MSYQFEYHTFGCKVNSYDTGLLQKRLTPLEGRGVHVHVLNTCAVTQEATREAVRLARRLKSRDPFCQVVVTGCAAQVDTEQFKDLTSVDLVVANSHKSQIADLIDQKFKGVLEEKVFKSNMFRVEDLGAGGGERVGGTRSFLKIQDGCNSFCSFCIIPFARGKSRSLDVSDLVLRVKDLEQQGFKEVVLTGVHIGDYRDSKGTGLEGLVEAVLSKTQIPRIRLSSLEPVEVTERLLASFADPRMCRHFHMSIQSAQTDVLHRMKRNYTAQDVEHSLHRIHQLFPDAFVGMDVIAGFTGETDEEFLETFERLKASPWTRLHVFPYSERQGTRAAREAIQVPLQQRMQRAQMLRTLSDERVVESAQKQIGQTKKVLVLKSKTGVMGLSRDYWHVGLPEMPTENSGREVDVEILAWEAAKRAGQNGVLIGRSV